MTVRAVSVVFVALILCTSLLPSEATDWWDFANCLRNKLSVLNSNHRCAAEHMWSNFRQMQKVRCKNCDKYFHCQGNYEAVYKCGSSSDARQAAEIISNCREYSQPGTDNVADQEANRYGRNGGNCASRYLCAVRCSYNPRDGSCKKSNCP